MTIHSRLGSWLILNRLGVDTMSIGSGNWTRFDFINSPLKFRWVYPLFKKVNFHRSTLANVPDSLPRRWYNAFPNKTRTTLSVQVFILGYTDARPHLNQPLFSYHSVSVTPEWTFKYSGPLLPSLLLCDAILFICFPLACTPRNAWTNIIYPTLSPHHSTFLSTSLWDSSQRPFA